MRPNVSAPAVLNAQDEELLLLTPEVWKAASTLDRNTNGCEVIQAT
ncbi:hypothetical protein [Xanthomonas oryzae]|nr:hypothetical protein [Xanthomonas oryzae]